jgi:hypothetical protein
MAIKFDSKKEVAKTLKFKPNPELGGLVLGTLENVEVITAESPKIKDDGSENMYEYAGLQLPILKFTFRNHVRPEDKDKAERFFIHAERPIVSKTNDGVEMDEKVVLGLYEQMWDRIKHIHDTFRFDPNYAPFKELDEINEKAAPDVRIKQLTKFFNTVATAFNDGKAGKIYQDEKGNSLVCWMKLVAEYPRARYLVFPNWVEEGFIERYKPGVPPVIELKPKDSQTLKSGRDNDEKSSSSPAIPGSDQLPASVLAMINNAK